MGLHTLEMVHRTLERAHHILEKEHRILEKEHHILGTAHHNEAMVLAGAHRSLAEVGSLDAAKGGHPGCSSRCSTCLPEEVLDGQMLVVLHLCTATMLSIFKGKMIKLSRWVLRMQMVQQSVADEVTGLVPQM